MRLVLLTLLLTFWAVPALAGLNVVASIHPVADLAAGVLGDAGTVTLLLPGGASPHHTQLRPSQVRALHAADLVVRVGPELELFLDRVLADLPGSRVLNWTGLEGVRLLPAREGGHWQEDDHEGHGHQHEGIDPHLWLDPDNARVLIRALADRFARLDPDHAADYFRRTDRMERELTRVAADIERVLAPVRGRPYLVFHDGYQYFERRFGLNPAGAVAVDPGRAPGARRLNELRGLLERREAVCLFTEPQFAPGWLHVLTAETGARVGRLDPLGLDLPVAGSSYLTLLERMAGELTDCLK
ncbi:MAG: zinc ABC transporter substrate-binding protein ZnuA [Geothermobacteraceae bacterium]